MASLGMVAALEEVPEVVFAGETAEVCATELRLATASVSTNSIG